LYKYNLYFSFILEKEREIDRDVVSDRLRDDVVCLDIILKSSFSID
jgi:hypothetical protein